MSDRGPDSVLPVGKLPSELLSRLIEQDTVLDPSVLIGPGVGRDAAAMTLGGAVLVAKTDPITFVSRDAAAYLVDINSNDLACLGATPRWLLVTALLPKGTTAGDVADQFQALQTACQERDIALVGGHTEVTTAVVRPVLVGQLLGETDQAHLLRSGGAAPGDHLLLSKAIAIEGTALLANERGRELEAAIGAEVVRRARALLTDPGIAIRLEARTALATGGVTALHDPTEGGLAMAVRELATAAGTGAVLEVDRVPVLAETIAIADHFALHPLGMLASGSLLIAAQPASVERLIAATDLEGVTLNDIGQLVPEQDGLLLRTPGGNQPLPRFDTDEVSRALMSTTDGDE